MTSSSTNRIYVIIDADRPGHRISRFIYGHFAEHLGRCIYDGFWVGPDSPIKNTRGIRDEIAAALKKIKIPVLRWPGGCFADEYHWMDGIGPNENRKLMVNTHWGGVIENNHFGTHEFMDLCAQLECEPYICGNLGSGSVQEMQNWVEYLTFDGVSPMADLRRRNGREEPWKVKFWGIGNENWGCGGNMRVEFYADLYRRYATYCRNFKGNRLYKIAGGANTADYHWTDLLMREARYLMDGLSLHYYTLPSTWEKKGPATGFDESQWFSVMKNAWRMDELLTRHGAIMDCYDPVRKIGLIVDEWGTWYNVEPGTNPGFLFQQNTLRDALAAGLHLNVFNRHCERVSMANLAQTVNVLQAPILTEGPQIVLTPTYHVFDLYSGHQDASLLPVRFAPPGYEGGDEKIPAVSISASRGEGGKVLVTLCNLDPSANYAAVFRVPGTTPRSVKGRILTASKMDAHNTFETPRAIEPQDYGKITAQRDSFTVDIPCMSVMAVSLDA